MAEQLAPSKVGYNEKIAQVEQPVSNERIAVNGVKERFNVIQDEQI